MNVQKKLMILRKLKNQWIYLCIGQKDQKMHLETILKKQLFGIVQGGLFNDLRLKSLEQLIDIDFDGYAMGGLAVGETQKQMFECIG